MATIFKLITFCFFSVFQFSTCLSSKTSDSNTPVNLFSQETPEGNITRFPLYISSDFGKTWKGLQQDLPLDAEISFIEKMEDEIVAATDNSGLFLSKNNKKNWVTIGDNLPSKKINALTVYDDEIFVGVYQKGIFSSKNKGGAWTNLNFNLTDLRVQTILKINGKLIIGTDSGIFKLENENQKWNQVFKNTQILSLSQMEGNLIAGTNFGTLLSLDKGETWKWIHQQGAIHYTHIVGDKIVEMYLSGDLFFSADFGKNWNEANYHPRNASYVYEVIEIDEKIIFSNNYGIHRSVDNGKSWENIYKTEHMIFFDFLIIGDTIFAGTRSWNEYRKRN